MDRWKRTTNALTMTFVFAVFSGDAVAEETILRRSEYFMFVKRIGDLREYCLQNCNVPTAIPNITSNELLDNVLRESEFLEHKEPQLRAKFTFTVYTKEEIDDKLAALQASISAQGKTIDQNRKVLDDTTRSVLLQIDKLPVELPTNPAFYRQMRERLKADIAADLDKAKHELTGQPQ